MTIDITGHDTGREIEMHPGDVLSLQLPENPTSSYRWFLTEPLPDFLEELVDTFTTGEQDIGGAGHRDMQITARAPGEYKLDLRLRHEWEPPDLDAQVFTVRVKVV